jgi:syntaxin 16
MPKFDDQENKKLNKSIKLIVNQMSKDLKNCEVLIKEIINDTNNDLDFNNLQIKQNLKQNVLTKLNEFTKKFKINQELYSSKFNDLVCDEDLANVSMRNKDADVRKSNDFLETQENNEQLRKRDNELNNLLDNVNELAQLFKDMQTLVMEQGTILDRIDYNIDIASTNVTAGKRNIVKAEEYQKKNCFRNVIIVLIICIFIEGILLIFKFI